jgi:CP family cyanate transporter-like MFS transporter
MAARAPFLLLWLCGVSLRLTVLAVPPVISIIQHDLGLSGTEIGLLSGIPVVIFAIFAAPGSIVIGRLGVRSALTWGLLIAALGGLLRSGAANVWQLDLASIVMSVGVAIMQPAMAAAVRDWVPRRSTFGTAVYTNGLIMGEIIPVALMLPVVLPWSGGNWRAALGVWSLPLLVVAVAVATLTPRAAANAAATHSGGWLPKLNSKLSWRIGLTLGSTTSTYFCLNGFLPSSLNGNGRQDLISMALTALNMGQLPASFLLLLVADKLQGKRWPLLTFALISSACVIGIMMSASDWTVFWAALAGFSLAGGLVLSLALPPLLCSSNEVALTSAAAFPISYGFAMLISFLSGVVWDQAGYVNAAFLPILFGSMPILVAVPAFARNQEGSSVVNSSNNS